MRKESIYELKLFDEYIIYSNSAVSESMKRVPGGWIHYHAIHQNNNTTVETEFIPFDNEFWI